ncbi:hypothetical protein CAPTEDRAFT_125679, partial [Capitella teleta]
FKVLALIHHAMHSQDAPLYLKDRCLSHEPTRNLRSNDHTLTLDPHRSHSSYGDRSFAVNAISLWNRLPMSLRSEVCPITY